MFLLWPPATYNTYIGLSDIGHRDMFTWDDGTEVVFTKMLGFEDWGKCGMYNFFFYVKTEWGIG